MKVLKLTDAHDAIAVPDDDKENEVPSGLGRGGRTRVQIGDVVVDPKRIASKQAEKQGKKMDMIKHMLSSAGPGQAPSASGLSSAENSESESSDEELLTTLIQKDKKSRPGQAGMPLSLQALKDALGDTGVPSDWDKLTPEEREKKERKRKKAIERRMKKQKEQDLRKKAMERQEEEDEEILRQIQEEIGDDQLLIIPPGYTASEIAYLAELQKVSKAEVCREILRNMNLEPPDPPPNTVDSMSSENGIPVEYRLKNLPNDDKEKLKEIARRTQGLTVKAMEQIILKYRTYAASQHFHAEMRRAAQKGEERDQMHTHLALTLGRLALQQQKYPLRSVPVDLGPPLDMMPEEIMETAGGATGDIQSARSSPMNSPRVERPTGTTDTMSDAGSVDSLERERKDARNAEIKQAYEKMYRHLTKGEEVQRNAPPPTPRDRHATGMSMETFQRFLLDNLPELAGNAIFDEGLCTALFNAADLNDDNEVGLAELAAILLLLSHGHLESRLRAAFRCFVPANSGYLTLDQTEEFLRTICKATQFIRALVDNFAGLYGTEDGVDSMLTQALQDEDVPVEDLQAVFQTLDGYFKAAQEPGREGFIKSDMYGPLVRRDLLHRNFEDTLPAYKPSGKLITLNDRGQFMHHIAHYFYEIERDSVSDNSKLLPSFALFGWTSDTNLRIRRIMLEDHLEAALEGLRQHVGQGRMSLFFQDFANYVMDVPELNGFLQGVNEVLMSYRADGMTFSEETMSYLLDSDDADENEQLKREAATEARQLYFFVEGQLNELFSDVLYGIQDKIDIRQSAEVEGSAPRDEEADVSDGGSLLQEMEVDAEYYKPESEQGDAAVPSDLDSSDHGSERDDEGSQINRVVNTLSANIPELLLPDELEEGDHTKVKSVLENQFQMDALELPIAKPAKPFDLSGVPPGRRASMIDGKQSRKMSVITLGTPNPAEATSVSEHHLPGGGKLIKSNSANEAEMSGIIAATHRSAGPRRSGHLRRNSLNDYDRLKSKGDDHLSRVQVPQLRLLERRKSIEKQQAVAKSKKNMQYKVPPMDAGASLFFVYEGPDAFSHIEEEKKEEYVQEMKDVALRVWKAITRMDRYPIVNELTKLPGDYEQGYVGTLIDPSSGLNMVHRAVKTRNIRILGSVLASNRFCRIEDCNRDGETPLIMAVRMGMDKICEMLLGVGADVNGLGSAGETPLTTAVKLGKQDIAQFLVSFGAEVDYTNKDGYSPLVLAVMEGHRDIAALLIEEGATVDMKTPAGDTPIILAVQAEDSEICLLLTESKALLNVHDREGNTCVMLAIQKRNEDILSILLKGGAPVSGTDKKGNNVLMLSAWVGYMRALRLLKDLESEYNVLIKHTNQQDNTPLMMAACNNHLAILKMLIADYSDNINTRNASGDSALTIAAYHGHHLIVQELLAHGAVKDLQNRQSFNSMMLASYNGHTAVIRVLLSADASMHYTSRDGSACLHIAASRGNVEILKQLYTKLQELGKEEAIHLSRDKDGRTALMVSAKNNQVPAASYLLEIGSMLDDVDNEGRTPLMIAAMEGNSDMVTYLLASPANTMARDRDGRTALLLAAKFGRTDVVDLFASILLSEDYQRKKQRKNPGAEMSAELEARDFIGNTPFILAAEAGSLQSVTQLVHLGAHIDNQNDAGYTALMAACECGHVKIIEFLIGAGATETVQNGDGKTALMLACIVGNRSGVEVLMERHEGLHMYDNDGHTAFMLAAQNGHVPILEVLLYYGAEMGALSHTGRTALMLAAERGHKDTISLLLDRGANIVTQDEEGVSALGYAALNGNLNALETLLEAGSPIEQVNNNRDTPLIMAVKYQQVLGCKLLLEHGAQIEAMNIHGETALLMGAKMGNVDVMETLLSFGAYLEAANPKGETPLMVAVSHGWTEIAVVLMRSGALVSATDKDGHSSLTIAIRCLQKTRHRLAELPPEPEDPTKRTNERQVLTESIGQYQRIVPLLLEEGADVNNVDKKGSNTIIDCAQCGEDDVLAMLVDNGAYISATDKQSRDVIAFAQSERAHRLLTDAARDQFEREYFDDEVKLGGITIAHRHVIQGPVCDVEIKSAKVVKGRARLADLQTTPAGMGLLLLQKSALKNQSHAIEQLVSIGANVNWTDPEHFTPLHAAVMSNDCSNVRALLDLGATVNAISDKGYSALMIAAIQYDIEIIQALLAAGAYYDMRMKDGCTALMMAVWQNRLDVVRLFIRVGVSLESYDQYGRTALMMATWHGYKDIAYALMEGGANPEASDHQGVTALMFGAITGHINTVAKLVEAGANCQVADRHGLTAYHFAARCEKNQIINKLTFWDAKVTPLTDKNDCTALLHAALTNNIKVIPEVLFSGSQINESNKDGFTPLIAAVWAGYLEVVRLLLSLGANPSCRTNHMNTPLMLAAWRGEIDLLDVIIEAVDSSSECINATNHVGNTALMIAAERGHEDIILRLVEVGAQVDIQNSWGNTAVMLATKEQNASTIRVLTKNLRADPNVVNNDTQSPLLVASYMGTVEVILALLEGGADILYNDRDEECAITIASRCNHSKAAVVLLEHGAPIEARDHRQYTPLIIACSENCVDTINELISHGANVEAKDEIGWTAVMRAAERGHSEVMTALIHWGASIFKSGVFGNTALILSAKVSAECTRKLLEAESVVDHRNNNGLSAIAEAAIMDRPDSIRVLDEFGGRLYSKSVQGNTPVHWATMHNSCDALKVLIELGANINEVNMKGETPLMLAFQVESLPYDAINLLLDSGASTMMRDVDCQTVYDIARSRGGHALGLLSRASAKSEFLECMDFFNNMSTYTVVDQERIAQDSRVTMSGLHDGRTLKVLLGKDGMNELMVRACTRDPFKGDARGKRLLKDFSLAQERNKYGESALGICALYGNSIIADKVLRMHPNMENKNQFGNTPLLNGAYVGSLPVVKLLLKYGSKINATNAYGLSALHLAAYRGHLPVVTLLVEKGASISGLAYGNVSPALCAAVHGHNSVLMVLQQHKAELDDFNDEGQNALAIACNNGIKDTVATLSQYFCRVSRPDKKNRMPSFLAAANGHADVIKLLAALGADLNHSDDDGETPLTIAAKNGQTTVVQRFLRIYVQQQMAQEVRVNNSTAGVPVDGGSGVYPKFDIHKVNSEGKTGLMIAAEHGHLPIVDAFMKYQKYIDVNTTDLRGRTALHVAAESGNRDIALPLIRSGCETDCADNCGSTALMLTAQQGDIETAEVLLSNRADIIRKDNDGNTCLHHAAWKGHHKMCSFLLNHEDPIPIDSKNKQWETPLMLAARSSSVEVIRVLVKLGAHIDSRNYLGATPLIIASSNDNLETVQLLLQSGAAANAMTDSLQTPLMCAAEEGHDQLVRHLIERGASLDEKNTTGRTAFMLASQEGHLECVKIMLESGNPTLVVATNDNGENALMIAARHGHVHLIETLVSVDRGRVAEVNKEGLTALMIAASVGHKRVIQEFSRVVGRDIVNLKDKNGSTAMIHAAGAQQEDCVIVLQQEGADINERNRKGDTALMLCTQFGLDKIVELLIVCGADVEIKNNQGKTALTIGMEKNQARCLGILSVKGGAAIHNPMLVDSTPLPRAPGEPEDKFTLARSGLNKPTIARRPPLRG